MQAIREGADAVIAVGGDGTLHEVQTHVHAFCSSFHISLALDFFLFFLNFFLFDMSI